jgi:hypothetical protein
MSVHVPREIERLLVADVTDVVRDVTGDLQAAGLM